MVFGLHKSAQEKFLSLFPNINLYVISFVAHSCARDLLELYNAGDEEEELPFSKLQRPEPANENQPLTSPTALPCRLDHFSSEQFGRENVRKQILKNPPIRPFLH